MTVITDFDGTIATLDVDWPNFKLAVIQELENLGLQSRSNFSHNIAILAQLGQLEKVAIKFECPSGLPILKQVNHQFISYLKSLDNFFVVSNNLTTTVEKSFQLLGLGLESKKIFGIDKFKIPKPSISAFTELEKLFSVKSSDCKYFGDRNSDFQFASRVGMEFKKISWDILEDKYF